MLPMLLKKCVFFKQKIYNFLTKQYSKRIVINNILPYFIAFYKIGSFSPTIL